MTARVLARLRGFHRDGRAQILPLVFFVGIAFFTGVVLVINTGRTVTHRMEAQSAVDAASVSGATAIARGMNYISSNNISMAKILASIVILRAFDPAIEEAKVALDVWKVVAAGMIAAGEALVDTLFGAAAGAVLIAAGEFLQDVKIPQEEELLNAIQPVIKDIVSAWDDNGNGIAWIALKVLAKLGDGLAYVSPLIAQYTAKAVFKADLSGASGWTDVWMLPLYPAMPACKGKFADFVDKVTHYAEQYEKPIVIAGWLLLTLSMFPLFYEANVKAELAKLFTGEGTAAAVDDPDAADLEKKNQEMKDLKAKLKAKEDELAKINAQIDAVNKGTKPGPYDTELGRDLGVLNDDKLKVQLEINSLQDQINTKAAEIKAITDKRKTGGPPPDGHPAKIDNPTGGKDVKDNKDVYPYLIDGKDWPKSFTYFTLAWSDVPEPTVPLVFKNPIGKSVVYAAARVVNSVEADLWTPAWHARLVRATPSTIPTNPIGKLPAACGEEGESGASKVPDEGGEAPDGDDKKNMLDKIVGWLSKH